MGVAMRNTSDAVSMLQTAEGAFSELTDIVQRMKDLATQAANDTNGADDRTALQGEFDALADELANIFDKTKYAGELLFANTDGKFTDDVSIQIGADSTEVMVINVATNLATLSAEVTDGGTLSALTLDDAANSATAIAALDTALKNIGTVRAEFGANINRLNHTSNNLANMKDNTEMAKGRIMDADFAMESANMSKNSMLMQSGISMLKQAGQMPGMVMGLLG